MGLEGMTKGVRAGVARRAGHFANAVSRIAEQRLGLGEPDFFQEVVEGHARRLTEQGRAIGGVHLHSSWNSGQVALARLGGCARQCRNKIYLWHRSFWGSVRAQSGGIGSGGESSLGKLVARAHRRVPALAQRAPRDGP